MTTGDSQSVQTANTVCPIKSQLIQIIAVRGRPKTIISDNGTELTSTAILAWSDRQKVACHSIAPSKPVQNAFI